MSTTTETPETVLARILSHAQGHATVDTCGWDSDSKAEPSHRRLWTGRVSGAPAVKLQIGTEITIMTPERIRKLAAHLEKLADAAEASRERWIERHTGVDGEYVE